MESCLFCRIRDGLDATKPFFQSEGILAIDPLEMAARIHIVLFTERHIESADSLAAGDIPGIWGHLLICARQLARDRNIGIDTEGYALVTNAGRHSTRQYPHLHVHLLSGAAPGI